MNRLTSLYISHFGHAPTRVDAITGSGSDRKYYRLSTASDSAIGAIGSDVCENKAFLYLDSLMRQKGFAAPQIYGVSDDGRCYLQQDLGSTALFDILHTPQAYIYIDEVMRTLPALQFTLQPASGELYPVQEMDERVAMWDLHYFKYCFLRAAGIAFDETALERDFELLLQRLWGHSPIATIYRDCQSRNVMIHEQRIWWIDFQSMRRGPVLYDVASFLWQARAAFTDAERAEYAKTYYEAMQPYSAMSREDFDISLRQMALIRTLQVLGAYGLRGLIERKAHFLLSIPAALRNALELIDYDMEQACPELCKVLRKASVLEKFSVSEAKEDILTVSVFSFSYKKGYPEDMSGNGGGFMFDCRALHNPGRYDEYKPLTGLDQPVIDFLEERGEIQPFLASAHALTDPAIERYIARGFSSLQIGFGCTGGRHRSVYSAQHTAEHIKDKFGDKVRVHLVHREQNIDEIL